MTSASMMPVEKLPAASWQTALGLGFVSAVFDNIPLTALALKQGGYDWGYLAYAVGFGGSMIWFGSSAGVALSNMYPEAKSVGQWLRTAGTWPSPMSSVFSSCLRFSAGIRIRTTGNARRCSKRRCNCVPSCRQASLRVGTAVMTESTRRDFSVRWRQHHKVPGKREFRRIVGGRCDELARAPFSPRSTLRMVSPLARRRSITRITGVTVTPCSSIETQNDERERAPQKVGVFEVRFVERIGEVVDGADPADPEEADHPSLGCGAAGVGKADPA